MNYLDSLSSLFTLNSFISKNKELLIIINSINSKIIIFIIIYKFIDLRVILTSNFTFFILYKRSYTYIKRSYIINFAFSNRIERLKNNFFFISSISIILYLSNNKIYLIVFILRS